MKDNEIFAKELFNKIRKEIMKSIDEQNRNPNLKGEDIPNYVYALLSVSLNITEFILNSVELTLNNKTFMKEVLQAFKKEIDKIIQKKLEIK